MLQTRTRRRFPQVLHSPVPSHVDVKPGAKVTIGRDVTIGGGFALASYAEVTIGDGVVIGPFVQVLDSDLHEAASRERRPPARPVRIERGAVIGAWSTVLPGARIGEYAKAAPYSVISGVVPPGSKVAGNPAVSRDSALAVNPDASSLELVQQVMLATFGLSEPPPPSLTRDALDSWDSLGAVRLLGALSEAASVTLPEADVLAATAVGELAAVVDRAVSA